MPVMGKVKGKRKGFERQSSYLNHTTSATEEEKVNDYHGLSSSIANCKLKWLFKLPTLRYFVMFMVSN